MLAAKCFFEDPRYKYFGPIVDTRPVWELRCGALTLGEKIDTLIDSDTTFFKTRPEITEYYKESTKYSEFPNQLPEGETLFINGRAKMSKQLLMLLKEDLNSKIIMQNEAPVAFKVKSSDVNSVFFNSDGTLNIASLAHLEIIQITDTLYDYLWDLVNSASNEIRKDIDLLQRKLDIPTASIEDLINIRNHSNIFAFDPIHMSSGVVIDASEFPVFLGINSDLGPGAIIDARKGPVWIDNDAVIMAGAMLIGPVYIGPKSIVRPAARLSDGVCLGPQCRVGGEVSNTIMIGYSNKQHSGYLGTSYVGEWVNFGAATDNSDLKNNYKPVDVTLCGEKVDSGDLHVGVMVADHCKTAIHTRLNSGTVAGVCCNLFGPDFPSKYVPSFTWFGPDGYMEYRLDKALETVRAVMPRRGKESTTTYEKMLADIFQKSANDRQKMK